MVLYNILKSLRKNVKMILLFKGILIIFALKLLSDALELVTINYLLDYVITWGPLALIIVFQPELRRALEQLGTTNKLSRILGMDQDLNAKRKENVYKVANKFIKVSNS